jgi:hypothetical protein
METNMVWMKILSENMIIIFNKDYKNENKVS